MMMSGNNDLDLLGKSFLVTGGSGFFGDYFVDTVLRRGASVINVDIVPSDRRHERLQHHLLDIQNQPALTKVFSSASRIDAVFHFAALLAHGPITIEDMYGVNVQGTQNLLDLSKQHDVRNMVFTSTNCLWGKPAGRPIAEAEPPEPCEEYGRAKLAAEGVLLADATVAAAIVRTPTIIQAGRLGLLAILFEFIDEGRKVWAVGGGQNRYQFIAAKDLAEACILASTIGKTELFNVGSAEVPTLRESYEYVIRSSGSRSRVATIPTWLAVQAMKLAHLLHVSPLGPYHWRMIAESFCFDTSKAERELGWRPTLGNNEILLDAYLYYRQQKNEIRNRSNVSAHRKATPMGVIKILKWLS
jgi:UDP-glucose 4-epimerase